MCNYCRKFTQSAQKIREGQDVNIGYEGEAFIDLFNNLIVHLDGCYNGNQSIEVSLPIKYCPWCGRKLEDVTFEKNESSKSCSYSTENGKEPCCTHECDGCMWYV